MACTFEGKPYGPEPGRIAQGDSGQSRTRNSLRDGLERILRGRTGALIVLGSDRTIDSICSGGFEIGIEFSPTRLRELAKMDGAIVCDKDASNIIKAAVQLVPDSSIETQESGTRHRTAERVAIQTGVPVISVSQSMQIIALYVNGLRHVLEGSEKFWPAPTRPSPRWNATAPAWTRSPFRFRPWKLKPWSRSGMLR